MFDEIIVIGEVSALLTEEYDGKPPGTAVCLAAYAV